MTRVPGTGPSADTEPRPGLARVVLFRLSIAAALAVLIQTVICLAENYSDELYFGRWYVEMEAKRVARGVKLTRNGLIFVPPQDISHFFGSEREAYAFRVIAGSGQVLAESNRKLFATMSPFLRSGGGGPDSWIGRLHPQRWFHIAGGITLNPFGRPVRVEVATLGDPARQRFHALALDFLEDVWIPLVPTLILAIGFAMFSIRRALKPLERGARLAETIDDAETGLRFDLSGMTREAASLCATINRLLERVGRLTGTQKRFIARAAHELRTPLAIMALELGKIADPRARRLEHDVAHMSDMVSRLLEIARLDARESRDSRPVDLVAIVLDVMERMAPLLDERKCEARVMIERPSIFAGDPMAVREAVRNLVENAAKHSPPGARIAVRCGPGAQLSVEDSGPGLEDTDKDRIFAAFGRGRQAATEGYGLGLAIVRQVVELHRGSIDTGRSPLGGARFNLRFASEGTA